MRNPLASAALALALLAQPAAAHVKWFAPYIVDATPRPVIETLADPFFWAGIALVLAFFSTVRLMEGTRPATALLNGMDRIFAPLDRRLDDVMRAAIAAFFVAVFAVGGIYLTPDLKTESTLIPWVQLVIALCAFCRPTQRWAAAGIVGLWVLALRDYELFHLLDYLALGLGVAAYLWLAASPNPAQRALRFDALRWAIAVSLMWSSLEKFAYPEWFYPLVAEKPYLTFGLPRDAFIPMAGVAEFTLGFGLLSTVLIRRLSAIALFFIFNAAVYPFGRIDLIGHGLIMAALVVVAAHAWKASGRPSDLGVSLLRIPASLATAALLFGVLYWGSHGLIYPQGSAMADTGHSTHSPDPAHPHPAVEAEQGPAERQTRTALALP